MQKIQVLIILMSSLIIDIIFVYTLKIKLICALNLTKLKN